MSKAKLFSITMQADSVALFGLWVSCPIGQRPGVNDLTIAELNEGANGVLREIFAIVDIGDEVTDPVLDVQWRWELDPTLPYHVGTLQLVAAKLGHNTGALDHDTVLAEICASDPKDLRSIMEAHLDAYTYPFRATVNFQRPPRPVRSPAAMDNSLNGTHRTGQGCKHRYQFDPIHRVMVRVRTALHKIF